VKRCRPGAHARLSHADVLPARPVSMNQRVVSALPEWIALGVTASKIVLGLPWYGSDFPCGSVSAYQVAYASRVAGRAPQCRYTAAFGGAAWEYYFSNDTASTPKLALSYYGPLPANQVGYGNRTRCQH
jgi:hypothetical protein